MFVTVNKRPSHGILFSLNYTLARSMDEVAAIQKAFAGRAIVYPVALLLLPVGWWTFGRRRIPFPIVADILFGLPFLIDVVGNALNLYDTIDWWDDANHLVNWALHTSAIGLLLRYGEWTPATRVALAFGYAVPITLGRVLIVDDEIANVELLARRLEAIGCQTQVASSGERAIALARSEQPDLILLDVMMPGIDGWQTCRRLSPSRRPRTSR